MTSTPPLLPRRTATAALLGFAGALLLDPSIALADGWEKMDEKNGIKVYKKSLPGSPLKAFRGTVVIDAPLEKLIWVLADNTRRKDWTDRLETSTILEQKSPYDFIMYQHFGAPAVVSDRDFVFRAHAYSLPDGSAVLEASSVTHPKAPPPAGVRGEIQKNRYVLKSLGKNKTRLEVIIMADPKGSLPGWVVNLVQKSWPMNTLEALRAHVKKPFVKTMKAPPLL